MKYFLCQKQGGTMMDFLQITRFFEHGRFFPCFFGLLYFLFQFPQSAP